jgi:very-short-patch-repair endonuclease
MENKCFTCGKAIDSKRHFCSKECHYRRKNYRRHTEETRQKIAAGNSKPFSEERKKAISQARLFKPTQELLEKLRHYWSLKYLNPLVIQDLCDLKNRKALYHRLFIEHCNVEQYKFMPSDWYPEDYQKLIELASQGVWYVTIAKMFSSSLNQITGISKKLGLPIQTHNPDAYTSTTSKLEKKVLSWIVESGYEINAQFHIGNFYFDAHIKNTNILIEVNGDYWHCNPKVYTNGPINDLQKRMMRRDFAKKGCAKINGYRLITIWENVVRKDNELAKDWLLKKVKEYESRNQDL